MTEAHALFAAAWAAGDDTAPLLILADLLDEQSNPDAAEMLRLLVAEGGTSRQSGTRTARLKALRADVWRKIKRTGWPDMAMQGKAGSVSFSRRPDPTFPHREHFLVRPDRRTMYHFRIDLDGRDEVVRTSDGRELLRRWLLDEMQTVIRERNDLHPGGAFSLAHDYFPFPDGWHADRKTAEANQHRQVEAGLAPAAISVSELPSELVPFVAWNLCEHVTDKGRRVRKGQVVPGAHLFVFRPDDGGWCHDQTLENRDTGRAVALLRQRFRRTLNGSRSGVASMLVRIADEGRVTVRKLVWAGREGEDRESSNVSPRPEATVAAEAFRRAADDLAMQGAVRERFMVDSPEKIQGSLVAEA